MKEIPADPFSANPLVYKPSTDGYLLYSIGKNLRDDGGRRDPGSLHLSSRISKDDIAAEVRPDRSAARSDWQD